MAKRKNKKFKFLKIIIKLALILGIGLTLLVLVLGSCHDSNYENSPPPREMFFENHLKDAKYVQKEYGLFPSVTLAQAALESGFGESQLTVEYNNYFGIKGSPESGVKLWTEEVMNDQWVGTQSYFRAYRSPRQSFDDYGKLLTTLERYQGVVQARSPEEAAYALYPAGYSTNPAYGDRIMEMIRTYNLTQYDEN